MADLKENPIHAALKKGEIPDNIRDAFHLITEGREAREFQKEMTEMTRELLGPQEADRLKIRFFLSADNSLNAGVIKYAQPPIMIFTRALIDALKEENLIKKATDLRTNGKEKHGFRKQGIDVPSEFEKNSKGMLMGMLAHEVNHIYKGERNSKGIEGAGDRYAVEKLIELGYREDSLIETRDFLLHIDRNDSYKYSRTFEQLAEYIDVHLKTANAIRTMDHKKFEVLESETTGFRTDASKKRIPPKAQALPAAFFDVTAAPYQSHVQQLLAARGYKDKVTQAEKLNVIHDIIKTEMPKWDKDNHAPRLEEIIKLAAFQYHYESSYEGKEQTAPHDKTAVKASVDSIADTLLGIGENNPKDKWYARKLYETIIETLDGRSDRSWDLKALGTYGKLAERMKAFIKAKDANEAVKAATETEELIKQHKLSHFIQSAGISLALPQFDMPDEYTLLNIEKNIYKKTGAMPQIQPISEDVLREIESEYPGSWRGGITPNWHQHVGWALVEKGPDRTMTIMLKRLGIDEKVDSRLPVLPSFSKQTPNGVKTFHNSLEAKVLTSAGGYIVGLPRNYTSHDRGGNPKNLIERAALLDQLSRGKTDIDKIDWEPVRSWNKEKFSNFCYTHRNELLPDVRKQTPATSFERKFIQVLEETLADKFELTLEEDNTPKTRGWFEEAAGYFFKNTIAREGIGAIMDATPEGARLDKNHPYIGFVQRNPGDSLLLYERAAILELTIDSKYRRRDTKDDQDMGEPVKQDIAFFRKSLQYTPPTTTEELFKLFDYLDQDHNSQHRDHYKVPLLKALAEHETLEFLRTHLKARFNAAQLAAIYELGKDENGALKKPFDKALSLYAIDHYKQELQLGAAELIHAYNLHQHSQFFKQRVDLREVYERAIMEKVEQVQSTKEKQTLLEALLLSDTQAAVQTEYFVYRQKEEEPPAKFLNNPEFRQWAIDGWAESAAVNTAAEAGIEGSIEPGINHPKKDVYYQKAEVLTDKVLVRSDGITRSAMLTQFLDRAEAQEKLSFHIRDRLNDVAEDQLAKLHYQVSAGEAFLDHLAYDPDLRKSTIEFLREPLTEESAKRYSDLLRKSAKEAAGSLSSEFPELRELIKKSMQRAELYDPDDRISIYAAEMLHKNFTNAPIEHRTPMMEVLLFPPNAHTKPMYGTTPQQYVFDAVLPESERYAKFGRSLLGHYLGSLQKDEDYIKRMYLAAMLVAEDPSAKEPDPQKRVGKAIHILLQSMNNPLASKLSQTIDSSNVPDWLRNPASKISANIPKRWVVWEMFNQNAPKVVKETTTRLGKTRAGAIGIAVELEKDTAKMMEHGYEKAMPKTVFKMLRKGAGEKVARHAPRATHMIEEAVKEFPELKKAKPILDHAIRAGEIETEFRNAPLQTEIAKRMTDGLQITIDGETFTFHEIPILKANSSSHEMAYANGIVFNELPKERKAKVAHALFTLEEYLPLLGQETDWDRHGAQAIVDGNHIYLLDRGGMALEPPKPEDKQLLGHTIATALNSHAITHTDFHEAVSNAVDATADEAGNLNPYLATIARGQYNLGDLRRELTPQQQMQSLMAAFGTGQVDPAILGGAMEALESQTFEWIMKQGKGASEGKNTIIINDPNIEKRKQPLDTTALNAGIMWSDEGNGGTNSKQWRERASGRKSHDPDTSAGAADQAQWGQRLPNVKGVWTSRSKPSPRPSDFPNPQRQLH